MLDNSSELGQLVSQVTHQINDKLEQIKDLTSGSLDDESINNIDVKIKALLSQNQRLIDCQQELLATLTNNESIRYSLSPGMSNFAASQKEFMLSLEEDITHLSEQLVVKEQEVQELRQKREDKKQKQEQLQQLQKKADNLKKEIEDFSEVKQKCDSGEIIRLEEELTALKSEYADKKNKLKDTESQINEFQKKIEVLVNSIYEQSKQLKDLDSLRQLEIDINNVFDDFKNNYDKHQVINIEALRDRIDFTKTVSRLHLTNYKLSRLDDITAALDKIDNKLRQQVLEASDAKLA